MKIVPFELERLLSVWQNQVEYDFTESGVHPIHLHELVTRQEYDALFDDIQLRYIQTNGPQEVKEAICGLYDGARPDNILVTNASSEANFLATWHFIEPGDDVAALYPTYMQVPGLAQTFGARVKPIFLQERNMWAPDLDELEEVVGEGTRFIYLANPNNPTGAILPENEMARIIAIAGHSGLFRLVAPRIGVVACLPGKSDGALVALRVDMDALPIREQTGLPFGERKI